MRIAQIVLPGASAYERKCQRVDHAALSEKHDVTLVSLDEAARGGADVAHVYASGQLPSSPFVRFPIPYISSAPLARTRWTLRRPAAPKFLVSPIGDTVLPEAVEESWFGATHTPVEREVKVVGSFAREGTRAMVEKTLLRIGRFRSDVTWNLYDREPTPDDLAGVDSWIDPAGSEEDFDGFVAEALVMGLPVVAARTRLNARRLEEGRTGFIIPPNDPNEMTHAILAALFKVEVAENKKNAARQTVSKFRARPRLRMLLSLYEQTIS
ncbi:MAG TPA: glycosyltransferase [Thermoanaerobaculia bacterium]|jgi:hypothetical protein